MREQRLWLQPDYFGGFHCKCGACRNCCCNGWDIAVGMEEYFRLIGMECSEKLHRRLECAFRVPLEPSPEHFRLISPNWLGECPMRDGDGLCMLQKECGEGALPEICRMYPRALKREGSLYEAVCSNSCEAVVENLMRSEQLRFSFREMDAKSEIEAPVEGELLDLGRRTLEILQGGGGLPMRVAKICGAISGGASFEMDPSARERGLCSLMGALSSLREESEALRCFGANAFARYGSDCPDAAQNFSADIREFEERFPDWERWFENILANHLVYMNLPCVDERLRPDQARAGLCAVYGTMRAICAAYTAEHNRPEDLADAIAGIFRLVEHSPFYYNAQVLISDLEALLAL